jgi:hypothetical protein
MKQKHKHKGDPGRAFSGFGAAPRVFAAFFALAILFANSFAAPFTVFAADDGVYLATTNTYYLNPDTGVTDDGGSRNAAIGEGMCRSVIYEKALVEIEDGKVYATVRMQLVSNMGTIKFTVQQKAGDPTSYAAASPRIIAEDAGADTADYRFPVPAVNSYIGCSTYVTPMGRDVKFYMNLSSDLTAGSGDFVVSVKPKAAQTQEAAQDTSADNPPAVSAPSAAQAETTDAETTRTAPAETPAEAESEAVPAELAETETETEAEAEESAPEETRSETDGAATNANEGGATDANEDGATDAARDAADEGAAETRAAEANEGAGAAETGDAGAPAETRSDAGAANETSGGFPVIPTVIVAILVVAVVAALVLRKRKS